MAGSKHGGMLAGLDQAQTQCASTTGILPITPVHSGASSRAIARTPPSPHGDPGLQYRADPRTFLATTLQGFQKQLSELLEALLPTRKEREGSRRQSEQWKPDGKNRVKPESLPNKQMVLGKLVVEKNGSGEGGS